MTQATTPEVLAQARELLQQHGWKQHALPGFIGTAGPLWTRRENDTWAYGILCGPQHLNPARVAHGGVVATLLDHAISTVAWEANERTACLTLQLDTRYLAPVREGQFIEARASVVHRTPGIVFMSGTATVDAGPVATAQAVMKVMRKQP